jgi:uncharacterized protein
MKKKVVIAGGTGFIGHFLEDKFRQQGDEVIIISRRSGHVQWNHIPAITAALENADLLINLAGRSVDCRYNAKHKKEILDSRVNTTRILGEAVLKTDHPPKLWINSSTATIYRHAEDRPMTESTGELGSGFSVEVAKAWEKTFFDLKLPATRQVALRMAIVLGKGGGVIKPLQRLARLGMGGTQGNGKQMFSWIHIDDLYGIINFIDQHSELSGTINTCAPNPVNNKTLMQFIRQIIGINIGIPMPAWLLRIGAVMIRTETELILKSRWVIPERLLKAGFVFKYANIGDALKHILRDNRARN